MVACPRPVAAEVVRGSWILKYISFLKPADLRMCLMGGVIRGEEAGVTLRYLAKPPEQGASINRSGKERLRRGQVGCEMADAHF